MNAIMKKVIERSAEKAGNEGFCARGLKEPENAARAIELARVELGL